MRNRVQTQLRPQHTVKVSNTVLNNFILSSPHISFISTEKFRITWGNTVDSIMTKST